MACAAIITNSASSSSSSSASASASFVVHSFGQPPLLLVFCNKKTSPPPSKTQLKKLLRTQHEAQQKASVLQSFHDFYQALYHHRWPSLLRALQSQPRSACLANLFADSQVFQQNMAGIPDLARLPFVNLQLYECSVRFPHPKRDSNNVCDSYMLDAASVLATEALELAHGDNVLDLCAAPGGKSLAILQQLGLPVGRLTANEVSFERRRRLWKVLVDAPCSSERHLLQNHEELYKWTEQRTVNCAKRQLALLNAGLKSVHVGGLVVYSTCSISYTENDGVIEKALKKLKIDFEVVHQKWLLGEETEHGWIVLPDTQSGWGPLYFSVLRRTQNTPGD